MKYPPSIVDLAVERALEASRLCERLKDMQEMLINSLSTKEELMLYPDRCGNEEIINRLLCETKVNLFKQCRGSDRM